MSTLGTAPEGVVAADIDVPGYLDLTLVHQSGFATTYRARREDGDIPVAVKVLGNDYTDPQTRRALNRYWLAAQRVTGQAYVLHVIDSGSTYAGQLYITTQYCELGSLGDRLSASGPLPIEDVLNAAVPVASALHAAHEVGMCHRGVTPNNILLAAHGQPMLADFVAAGLRADQPTSPAGSAARLHTAPEVLSGGKPTPSSDTYSLAATVFHLLAGRPPYSDGGEVPTLLPAVMNERPPLLGRTDVPESLRAALSRALAAEPEGRFPDALSFAAQLHHVLIELDLAVRYPATIVPTLAAERPAAAELLLPAKHRPPRPRIAAPPTARDNPSAAWMPHRIGVSAGAPRRDSAASWAPQQPLARTPYGVQAPAPPRPRPVRGNSYDPADSHDTVELHRLLPVAEPIRVARRRRGLRSTVAAVGLAVVVALAGLARHAAVTGAAAGTRDAQAATAAARQNGETPATSSPTDESGLTPLAELTPVDVTATDDGTTVGLHWTLPANASLSNIVIQQEPVEPDEARLTILNPGATSHPVTGLDPTTRYCFLVGVLAGIGSSERPIEVAWAAPVGVRGACTVASS